MEEQIAAIELRGVPASTTFDDLRAIIEVQAVCIVMEGSASNQATALALLGSAEEAAAACDLLDGSPWGAATLSVKLVPDVQEWLVSNGPEGVTSTALQAAVFEEQQQLSGTGAAPPPDFVHEWQQDEPGEGQQPLPQQQQVQQQQSGWQQGWQQQDPSYDPRDWEPDWQMQEQQHELEQQDLPAQPPAQHAAYAGGGSQGGGDDGGWQEVGTGSSSRGERPRSRPRGGGGSSTATAAGGVPSLDSGRLMVRNLSPETTQAQVAAAFKKFGRVVHVVKTGSKRYAHVQFDSRASAAAALEALNETLVPELNSSGVIFVAPSYPASDSSARVRAGSSGGASASKKNISDTPTSVLWVGNLQHGTQAERVREVFSRFGALLQWQVERGEVAGRTQLLRYAIVQFRRQQDAVAAYGALNHQYVDELSKFPLKIHYRVNAEELRSVFGQAGDIRQLILSYDSNAAEGQALVAYSHPAAATEAVDLLDAYPMGSSLLDEVGVDQYMGRLLSSLLAKSSPWQEQAPAAAPAVATSGAAPAAAEAGGGTQGGLSALEDEMRELQLHLQQHADDLQQYQAPSGSSQQDEDDDGWQDVAPARRPHPQHQHQHPQPHSPPAGAGGGAATGSPDVPNSGLWIGWIDLGVEKADLAAALSQFGPVSIEHLQAAQRPAYDGRMYKWGIARFRSLEDSVRAKKALAKQVLPGISVMPLKVTYYHPHHSKAK
ncbi:hypothetical protein CHLNCDRAFT_144170 [Chlorella variabilis]|uniref:RRM domain-containing protein n=1 Tax=Chlorella variabilis TaxID=554065 RepID=E1ZC26_CHLVA|nr:hypothetical protein CHLNCDRAFT_144170 [Chlorella variabilis]EFN56740.1 hypothetical protein CHLNCDRAFT_144170 [Chlorella variabilis]|eukprot:XP_005848842.1 hypothetical protein CHLNCDRAFT_144170 [Chlorella variabilis]